MKHLESPAEAERKQARKAAFIPAWPVVLGVLAIIVVIVVLSLR